MKRILSGTLAVALSLSVWSCGESITGGNVRSLEVVVLEPEVPSQPGTGTPGYWKNHPEAWGDFFAEPDDFDIIPGYNIWEAIEKIERFIIDLKQDTFSQDEKTVDAVVRNLEIIGEASNRLPEELKKRHTDIEWRQITGLRNRIIHEYFGVDQDIIWRIVQQDLPAFKSQLQPIRESLENE